MANPRESAWRVVRPSRLRVQRFADEVVLYDDRSGDTHLLDDLAGRVLERLLGASARYGELTDLAAGEDSARRGARILTVLERLHRLGVIKPLRK